MGENVVQGVLAVTGTLKKCRVQYKNDGKYIIMCTTERFGRHAYRYAFGDDRMWQDEKKYVLLEPAASAVLQQAAEKYESAAEQIRRDGSFTFISRDIGDNDLLKIWFRYQGTVFDALCILENAGSVTGMDTVANGSFDDIGFALHRMIDAPKTPGYSWLLPRCQRSLEQNPIYQSICRRGDRYMQIVLEQSCGEIDDAALEELTGQDGMLRLRRLSEEYNHGFSVLANTVDFGLLVRSGYKIAHRANICMMGSLRDAVTLNPREKSGLDAAYEKLPRITFAEYLQMFGPGDVIC